MTRNVSIAALFFPTINFDCVSFNMVLSSEECNLKQIDLEAVQNEVEKATASKKKRGAYFVYSPEERFNIAKYAVENGTSRAVHHFKRKYSSFIEKKQCLYVQG